MNLIEEMAAELARAFDLCDWGAAERIAADIVQEAQSMDLDELGDSLARAVAVRDFSTIPGIVLALAKRATTIDAARHEVFGVGFLAGQQLIDLAFA